MVIKLKGALKTFTEKYLYLGLKKKQLSINEPAKNLLTLLAKHYLHIKQTPQHIFKHL